MCYLHSNLEKHLIDTILKLVRNFVKLSAASPLTLNPMLPLLPGICENFVYTNITTTFIYNAEFLGWIMENMKAIFNFIIITKYQF